MTQSAEILVRTSLPEILRVVVYINEISIMNTISSILSQKLFTCVAQLRNVTNYGATLSGIFRCHFTGKLRSRESKLLIILYTLGYRCNFTLLTLKTRMWPCSAKLVKYTVTNNAKKRRYQELVYLTKRLPW